MHRSTLNMTTVSTAKRKDRSRLHITSLKISFPVTTKWQPGLTRIFDIIKSFHEWMLYRCLFANVTPTLVKQRQNNAEMTLPTCQPGAGCSKPVQ